MDFCSTTSASFFPCFQITQITPEGKADYELLLPLSSSTCFAFSLFAPVALKTLS